MHIVFAMPYYAPAWSYGGPARVMSDLGASLVRRGHRVSCVTTDALDHDRRIEKVEDVVDGVRVRYVPNRSNFLAYHFKFFTPLRMGSALAEVAAAADIVHIADFRNLVTFHAWRMCAALRKPFVLSPFGTVPNTMDLRGAVKKLFDLTWSRNCLRAASVITAQTGHERDVIRRFGVDDGRIELVPLHVDAHRFESGSAPVAQPGVPLPDVRSGRFILFVGRMNIHKVSPFMIDVLLQVRKQLPDVKLVMVGRDDGAAARIRQYARRHGADGAVLWPGPVYYPETCAFYQHAGAFFMAPSHYEETPTAALEALAGGCPVVVTPQAEVPFLEEAKAGFVPSRNVQACARRLIDCIRHREAYGPRGVRLVRDRFDLDCVCERYQEIYRRTLA